LFWEFYSLHFAFIGSFIAGIFAIIGAFIKWILIPLFFYFFYFLEYV
jgi:hypothetical protein